MTLPEDFASVAIKRSDVEPTSEEVEEQISDLLSQYSSTEHITDRAAADGDTVNIHYVGSVTNVEFTGGSAENYDLTPVSYTHLVKTRLGVTSPEEFEAILDLYDRYPICELTVHPRVMRQLYRGEADRAAFAKYLPHCQMPVCYNGDITTPAQLKALEAEFPNLSGIMVGRGIIADPALLRQAVGGAPASKEELRGYLDELYHGYTEAFGMASCAVSRMKAHWHYLIQRFEGSEAFEKQLRKAREGWEYEVVVNQLFTLPLL